MRLSNKSVIKESRMVSLAPLGSIQLQTLVYIYPLALLGNSCRAVSHAAFFGLQALLTIKHKVQVLSKDLPV